ncbi:hypothetical protein BGZ61DRAFT_434895 [Ilyonectria robusta]|uniref:uncharacterized protein n=1 Tax=Ilyonectria robusta TaxID=1079257 RepID=UPI001E8D17A6|nr:uncharacterized protein BGZ61DRAFT_434895 [Ilyonectria robusta]KAH8654834.1 hypothetical protein BGZ61DRAFT_434895 [Ilyonectria robusta]
MAIENRGPELTAVCATFTTMAVIAVALRCYVRLRIIRNFGLDDWAMVGALVSFLILIAFTLLGVRYGTGRHYWDLKESDIVLAMKYWWHCYLWYCITMITCKISIGLLLLRIAVRRVDICIIYTAMAVTVLTCVAFFFITLFQCSPISFFWTRQPPGSCINVDVIITITYIYSSFSVLCDFTFALLPISMILKLNMNKQSKIALIPIMLMACVASAAVVVRFGYVKDFKNPDFLYATLDIAIWSTVEGGLGITAGSLATLRPLFRIISPHLGFSTRGASIVHDSDRHEPRELVGSSEGTRGTKKYGELFSLTTFKERNERDKAMVCETSNDGAQDTPIRKYNSTWVKQDTPKLNESEEELTMTGSRERLGDRVRIYN